MRKKIGGLTDRSVFIHVPNVDSCQTFSEIAVVKSCFVLFLFECGHTTRHAPSDCTTAQVRVKRRRSLTEYVRAERKWQRKLCTLADVL